MTNLYQKRLTKEKIKAIRIVKGFNSDLRTNLHFDKRQISMIVDFIFEHRVALLGCEYCFVPNVQTDEYDAYEKMLRKMAMQVSDGKE